MITVQIPAAFFFFFFGEGGRGAGQFILKIHLEGFPDSPVGKNLPCNAGDID